MLASLTVPGHERIVERLERARLPFVVTEPVSVADVYSDIVEVGALLGASAEADRVVSEMRVELGPSATPGSGPVSPRRMVAETGHRPGPLVLGDADDRRSRRDGSARSTRT